MRTLTFLCALILLGMSRAMAAPVTFNTALPVGEGKLILREQLVISRSGDDPLGLARELDTTTLESVIVYGPTPKLALFGVLPFADRSLTAAGAEQSNSGIGDITFFGRYTLGQRDGPACTLRLAGFAGMKAPTGEDDASDASGRLPGPLQPGTGAWDGFLGGVLSYQTLDFGVDTQLSYRVNGSANGFQAGDEIRLDGSFQRRLWPRALTAKTRGFLFGVLELNASYRDRNEVAGARDPDSGGTTLYVTPGLQYVTRKVIVEGAAQVPVAQNLNGGALENDWIFRGGFRINF